MFFFCSHLYLLRTTQNVTPRPNSERWKSFGENQTKTDYIVNKLCTPGKRFSNRICVDLSTLSNATKCKRRLWRRRDVCRLRSPHRHTPAARCFVFPYTFSLNVLVLCCRNSVFFLVARAVRQCRMSSIAK